MKQSLLILSLALSIATSFGQSFQVDSILYSIKDVTNQTASLVLCSKTTGSVTIPSSVTYLDKSYTVTVIENHAFANLSKLTGSLTIPNSIVSIGDYAFFGCEGFTGNLTIPNSVTTIGKTAFCGCSRFTGSLSIPNSVITVGEAAFFGCEGFSGNLIIANSVTSIGSAAFLGCSRLTGDLSIPNSVTFIGSAAFFYCTGFTGSLTIPNSLNSIKANTFWGCKGLTDVIIPSSIISIETSAFQNCTGLKNINIPSSVTSIGQYAFYGCTELTSISVDPNNSNFSSIDGVFFDKNKLSLIAFPNKKTSNYSIPSSVRSIEKSAFVYCTNLEGVNIPLSVDSIKENAFYGSGLTSVNIPSSVGFIGNYAFSDCAKLTSITVDPSNSNYSSIDGVLFDKDQHTLFAFPNKKTTNYSIPSTTSSIGTGAFLDCKNLTNVNIPSSVISIGEVAFSDCTNLADINIPSSVISIGAAALHNTGWYNNQANGLIYAGKIAYSYKGIMPSNTTITLKTETIGIADQAFYTCSGLTNIILPPSLTHIGKAAFSYCSGLTSIIIPPLVNRIETDAFNSCLGLSSIYCHNSIPVDLSTVSGVFSYVNKSTCTLYVPKGSVEAYRAAEQWTDFLNIVEFDATTDIKNTVENKINIFYNPNTSSLIINDIDKPVYVTIYDINGKLCYSGLATNAGLLHANKLPKGVYIVNVINENLHTTQKVMVY